MGVAITLMAQLADCGACRQRTFCTLTRELSSRRLGGSHPVSILNELRGVRKRPMIVSMPTTDRSQKRYDYRLRDLVHRTRDATVATNLGVPRSTARGWLSARPTVVVSLDVMNLNESELRQEVLK